MQVSSKDKHHWWTIPRMWEGKTVACFASGKSMTAEVAATVRGIPCIAINENYNFAPWADVLYAADVEWWQQNPEACALPCIKVACINDQHKKPPEGVLSLRATGTTGIEPDPSAVRTGSNSGYQAVHVAYHAGASRILLCGYNMGGPNWHGPHKLPLRNTGDAQYVGWRRVFEDFARELGKRGVEVVNVTPNSSLSLPFVPLEEALACAVSD